MFMLWTGTKKCLALTCRVLYTCDDLFTRTRVLIRFKIYYIYHGVPFVFEYKCMYVNVITMLGEAKRAQTVGNKKKTKKKWEKNERLPMTTCTGQRLSNCPCAYMKPFITINCIVWTAVLLLYIYIYINV